MNTRTTHARFSLSRRLHRFSLSTFNFALSCCLLLLAALPGRADDPEPSPFAGWPADPYWTGLTNHIQSCYEAVRQRAIAADQSPDNVYVPTFICPYADYVGLGQSIDSLAGGFLDVRNLGEDGTLDAWLDANGNSIWFDPNYWYPTTTELPLWNAQSLREYCGVTGSWQSVSLLTSWAVCDRSIQTKIETACLALTTTRVSAVPGGAHRWEYRRSWGNGETIEETVDESCVPFRSNTLWDWPSAYVETASTAGIAAAMLGTSHVAMGGTNSSSAWLLFESPTVGIVKPWTFRGNADLEFLRERGNDFLTITRPGGHDWIETDDEGEWSGRVNFIVDGGRRSPSCDVVSSAAYDQEWVGDISVVSLSAVVPYVWSQRESCEIAMAPNCPTNVACSRDLYVIGGGMRRVGMAEYLDAHPLDWQPEVGNLNTDRFERVFSEAPCKDTNTVCDLYAGLTGRPYGGALDADQRGWDVAGGFWLLNWNFDDAFPEIPEDSAPVPPDTDLDGIVRVPGLFSDARSPYGTAQFLPDWPEPFVRIPLAAAPFPAGSPQSPDALPVHIELTSGRGEGLPYRTAVQGAGWPWWETPQTWQLGTHLSLATRISEIGVCTNAGAERLLVSILRPHGRIVAFSFEWKDGDFAVLGYPVGRDAPRTYVLERPTQQTEFQWFSRGPWILRFEDGNYHSFGSNSYWGELLAVGHDSGVCATSGHHYESSAAPYNLRSFIRGYQSRFLRSAGGYPIIRGIDRGRHEHTTYVWDPSATVVDDGVFVTDIVCLDSVGETRTTVTLQRDASGQITGMTKTGFGADTGFSISEDRKTITHAWGTETLSDFEQDENGTSSRVAFTTPAGSWDEEWQANAVGHPTLHKLVCGTQETQSSWTYQAAEGRYTNGVPKNAKVHASTAPDGSTTTYAYDAVTGWPTSATGTWHGLASVWQWDYTAPAGDASDPKRTTETPRITNWLLSGTSVSRTLTSIEDERFVDQHLESPNDTWGAPSGYVVTNTMALGGDSYSAPMPALGLSTNLAAPWTGWSSSRGLRSTSFTTRTEEKTTQSINLDGYATSKVVFSDEYTPVASNYVTSCDALGRPVTTVFSDGTSETTDAWGLFGPTELTRRDQTTVGVEYDVLGRAVAVEEPDLDRTTTIAADPLGLSVATTVTAGGAARVFTETRDILGRPLTSTGPLGTTSWTNWQPATGGGWTVTVQRPGLGDLHLELDPDGSVRKQYGPGAQACLAESWRVDAGTLRRRTTVLSPTGTPLDEWTETEYDFLGRPWRLWQAGIATPTVLGYDAAGNVASVTDPSGVTTLATYDERIGLAAAGVKRGGNPAALEPGGTDRMAQRTLAIDAAATTQTLLAYPLANDPAPSVVGSVAASHNGRSIVGTSFGRAFSATNTSFTGPGVRTATVQLPGGRSVASAFEPFYTTSIERDAANAYVADSYVNSAPDGSEVDLFDSRSGLTRLLFDSADRLERTDATDFAGEDFAVEYKPDTALPARVEGAGRVWAVTYYPNGLPHTVQAPGEPTVTYGWDSAGRLASASTTVGGRTVERTWVRDSQTGRLWYKAVDGEPVEGWQYRDNGQVANVGRYDGALVEFTYGPGGDLAETVDTPASALSAETVHTVCDRLGRAVTNAVAGGISEGLARQPDGAVSAVAVQGGGVVPDHALAYALDSADGAPLGWQLTSAAAPRTLATARNAALRVTNLVDGPVSAAYAYNSRGAATSVVVRVGGTSVLRHAYAWHAGLGVRTNLAATLVAPGASPPLLPSFGLPRDPGTNRIVRVLREDGTSREAAYTDGRLARWTYRRADHSADPARSHSYAYDAAGGVLRAGPVNADGEGRAVFTPGDFDLHVVRRWNAVELVGTAPTNATVTADGEAVEREGERFRFVIPLRNPSSASMTNLLVCAVVPLPNDTEQYVEQPVSLRLPAMPEEIAGSLAGVTTSDSLTEYLFDARGRLRRVTDKAVSVPRLQSVYDYYPDGRRARKLISVHTNGVWQLTRTHQYVYDRWNLIQETITNQQSQVTNRHFTWGLDLAGLSDGAWRQDAGGIGGLLAIAEVTGSQTNVFLPVCDQVGTVHALVAAMTNNLALTPPALAAQYEYSPYGELLERTGDYALSCPMGFQSKYRDDETGFSYFGYRYFDSRAAQWLSHDPLREGGGFNLAAFCGGDPVNQVDPLGLAGVGAAGGSTALVRYGQSTGYQSPALSAVVARMRAVQSRSQIEDLVYTLGPSGSRAVAAQYGPDLYRTPTEDGTLREAWREGLSLLDRYDHGVLLPSNPTDRERVQETFNRQFVADCAGFMSTYGGALQTTPRIVAIRDGVMHYTANGHEFQLATSSVRASDVLRMALRLSDADIAAIESGVLPNQTTTVSAEQGLALSPWPPNRGFIEGTVGRKFLMPGETFDRFGFAGGTFASPTGIPLEMRSLRPGTETLPYHNYRVLKPFEVNVGGIAPAFLKPGLGTQYELPVSIRILLKRRVIEEVP